MPTFRNAALFLFLALAPIAAGGCRSERQNAQDKKKAEPNIGQKAALNAAGDYVDPAGFTLAIPEGYNAVNKLNFKDAPDAVKQWMKQNNVDPSEVGVIVMKTGGGGASLSVASLPEELGTDDETIKEFADTLPEEWKSLGIKVEGLKVERGKVAGLDCILVNVKTTMRLASEKMQQRQMYVPAPGKKTLILTITTSRKDFDALAPAFEKIANSLKFTATK